MAWKYSWEGWIGRRIKSKKQGFWDKKKHNSLETEKCKDITRNSSHALSANTLQHLSTPKERKASGNGSYLPSCQAASEHTFAQTIPNEAQAGSFRAFQQVDVSVRWLSSQSMQSRGETHIKKGERFGCRNSATSVTFTCVCIWVL